MLTDFQHGFPGAVCPDQLLVFWEWSGTIGPAGGTINWTRTEYECVAPGQTPPSTTTTGTINYTENCGIGSLLPMGGAPSP